MALLSGVACRAPAAGDAAPRLAAPEARPRAAEQADLLPIIFEHSPWPLAHDSAVSEARPSSRERPQSLEGKSPVPGPQGLGCAATALSKEKPSLPDFEGTLGTETPADERATTAASSPPGDAAEPCHSSSFELALVSQACRFGGRRAAKQLMARAVREAQASGVVLTCLSCHADEETYALGPNAVADLRPWL